MTTLWSRLDQTVGPTLIVWDHDAFVTRSWGDWRRSASRIAAGLQRHGVRRGDVVGCLLENTFDTCATILGVWMCGAQVASMPLAPRGMGMLQYRRQLAKIVRQAGPSMVLAEDRTAAVLSDALEGFPIHSMRSMDASSPVRYDFADPSETAFIQYSSGSTSTPKGCRLSAWAIANQLEGLAKRLEIDPERDAMAAWLPLSHDMGLFGCLMLSYWTSMPLTLSTPQRFVRSPMTWMTDCLGSGATVTAAPGFALDLVARMLARGISDERLALTRLVLGGERVDPDTLDRWSNVAGSILPSTAVTPAYGLAEATLAVTMTAIASRPFVVTVDREALTHGEVVEPASPRTATRIVGAGTPMPGCTVHIDGPAEVGEVVVQSPSLADGYLDAPATTARKFTPDGLRTGDLGFLRDGHLFITGRADDLITVGGRNVYASDAERAMCLSGAARTGHCAVVGLLAGPTNRLVGIVEGSALDGEHRAASRVLSEATRRELGVSLDGCVFVEAGMLPRTPSGKLQRHRCRQIVEAGPEADGVIAHVRLTHVPER